MLLLALVGLAGTHSLHAHLLHTHIHTDKDTHTYIVHFNITRKKVNCSHLMANFFILDSSSVETSPYVVITELLEQSSVTLIYLNMRQGGCIRCVLIKDLDKGKRVRRVLSSHPGEGSF